MKIERHGTTPTLKEVRDTKAIETTVGGAFGANEVISEDECTTTALAAVWTFSAVTRKNAGFGYIVGATIGSESESVTPRLTLFLFNTAPSSSLESGSANTAPDCDDYDKYIGKIDFPAMESLGTTGSVATVSPSTAGGLPLAFKCETVDDIYGILVTRDAFTQTDGDDMTIILLIEQYCHI